MDALALTVAAALLFLGVAAVAVRAWRVAVGAVALGLCLPLATYADDLAAPAYLAVISAALAPVTAPLAAWAFVRARLVPAALLAAAVAGPVATLLYDPFYDLRCIAVCDPNPLAVAHISATAHSVLWAAAFFSAAALTVAALRAAPRLPVLVLAGAAWLVAFDPERALPAAVTSGAVLLAVGGTTVTRTFEARARVSDLARALESAADVEATLRAVLGDPGITVTYLVDPDRGEVDRSGVTAAGPTVGQTSTDINGPDGVVARVHHDPERTDPGDLARALTGPARLALENGRLEATVRSQAQALEASRRRIVVLADTERQRLERDLHDGAQQHLLALGLSLSTTLDTISGDPERDALHRSLADTHVALGELRDLSHGFYPASLEQTGLANALDGVADRAPVPVSVGLIPENRLPAEVERAIFLLVARAAATAHEAVTVTVSVAADVVDVGVEGARPPYGVLSDVFAVLGGSLDVGPGAAGHPMVHGRLPLGPHLAGASS